MPTRQKIGLRKEQPKIMRAPGKKRRENLLNAASALLGEKDIEDISFREIAARAEVPEGSAYHFFANRFDVFAELANTLNAEFCAVHAKPVPAAKRKTPAILAAHMIDLGAGVYGKSAPARQLFIGGKTPLEVRQAGDESDRDVAAAMHASFARYFNIGDSAAVRDAFYYFIGITDYLFSLSVVEHGKISTAMLKEAKRAGVAYLETYL
ncbi:MAG: TetR/AcrR family transcriptional regulator [Pseudomonadota bacterium]